MGMSEKEEEFWQMDIRKAAIVLVIGLVVGGMFTGCFIQSNFEDGQKSAADGRWYFHYVRDKDGTLSSFSNNRATTQPVMISISDEMEVK